MKITNIISALDLKVISGNNGISNEVTGGYVSDLLSEFLTLLARSLTDTEHRIQSLQLLFGSSVARHSQTLRCPLLSQFAKHTHFSHLPVSC